MAVKFKQKNSLATLEKIGIAANYIAALKQVHAALLVGEDDIQINLLGQVVTIPELSGECIDLITNIDSYPPHKIKFNTAAMYLKAVIEKAIKPVLDGAAADPLGLINPGNKVLVKKPDYSNVTFADPTVVEQPKALPGVIPLRDAKALYQRVNGTSPDSVYVAVGISENCKVAARVLGNKLAVRVEGSLSPFAHKAFSGLGIDKKVNNKQGFEYYSQHFDCNEAATPEKVLGAILLGCGIKFDSGLPDVNKVRELSQ